MDKFEHYKKIIKALHKTDLSDMKNLSYLLDMCLAIKEFDIELAKEECQHVKNRAAVLSRRNQKAVDLYWKAILFLAQNRDLDSYLLYLEKNRDPEDRFYLPRRKQLRKLGLIQALQDLIDDKIEILSISCPPGVGKTTLAEMFLSGWIGWDPDACNLFSSHSGHVTRMVYDVLCNIIGVDLKQGQIPEYTWREIFPSVQIEGVNDDLCSGIEEALSKIRLDKLWTKYSTDLKTRKKKGRKGRVCKELHIATRWSVWDVIGRLQRLYEGKKKKCKFIAIPDLDPETGLSNWDYQYGVGFDEEYFQDIADTLDDVTYRCLYKNAPVEREGLLYDPDKLRRYNGILPPGKEPDQILAILDPKGTGTDYNCMGVFYQFGDDYYLHDVVFKNTDPYLLDDYNADCLVRNNVQICQIESNKEGVRTGDKIQEKVDDQGGRCCIEKKYTTTNKETRIIVNSPWVIKHVVFKDPECYAPKSDYGEFMSWLCAFSQLGKNPHDDAPDMVAMLAVRESGTNGVQTEVYGTDQRSLLGL